MSKKPNKLPRVWQRMLSGRRLDLINPAEADIEVEDIAHGLARVARWNGQTMGDCVFSVAQHSILVERIFIRLFPGMPKKWRLACLLHDAPEYVIGDLIAPFKSIIGGEYINIEARIEAAIHIRFGLPPKLPRTLDKQIKRADKLCAYMEAVQLAGFSETEARRSIANPRYVPNIRIDPQPAREAEMAYIERFERLGGNKF